MALTKPVLPVINAFDATQQHIFTFSVVSGGDQVTQNRLTIIRQDTGEQVYQQTQTTFAYSHTLPANTLTNGLYYSVYLNTYNAKGDISPNSDTLAFYCFTTPVFAFSNLPVSGIVTNSGFSFQVTYNQTENEPLNSYEFFLYDVQNIEIANSGIKYVGEATIPTIVSYSFGGLTDGASYYVKAIGVTLHGTQISTDLVLISVQYEKPNVFAIVELSQNCEGGYVTVKSNMSHIEGTSNPAPPRYVDNNTAVDVTGADEYVSWAEKQYDFSGDFTLGVWGRSFNPCKEVITLSNDSGDTITIRYLHGYYQNEDTLKAYADCTIKQGTGIYYIYSDYITIPANTDKVQFWLRRINNIYQIGLYKVT